VLAERRALLATAEDRHDRRGQIERQRSAQVSRSGAGGPQPGQQLTADGVVLPHVGPLARAEPLADRRRALVSSNSAPSRPGAEHRGVVDAVPAGRIEPITVNALLPQFAP
jgi:hypothetical protein